MLILWTKRGSSNGNGGRGEGWIYTLIAFIDKFNVQTSENL